ncbi:MAG: serine/threonine-protein phosphatase [Phycisphaerales bacterium]|nr:serine/threonine-protein phosphatase [Phycisphaerales bacterium]
MGPVAAGAVPQPEGGDAHVAVPFACAEIWGGNRSVDQRFDLPGIRGRIFSQPSDGGRGGDLHYISLCNSGLLSRICLADVVGHGARVARAGDVLHRLLRRYMNSVDQRRVLRDLNRALEAEHPDEITTALALSYLPPTRLLSVSYAGHPPAWLYRVRTRRWEPLRPATAGLPRHGLHDLPLGVDPSTRFTRRMLRVIPGDRLLAITDGVLEAPGSDGTLFGVARLQRFLESSDGADADLLIDRLRTAIVQFSGNPALSHDDVTILLLEFMPGPPALGIWHMVRNRLLRRLMS